LLLCATTVCINRRSTFSIFLKKKNEARLFAFGFLFCEKKSARMFLLVVALAAGLWAWLRSWWQQAGEWEVFYINLARRKDRLQLVCAELRRVGLRAARVEAVDDAQRPWMGCSRSHLLALTQHCDPRKHHAVFEDDACFNVDRAALRALITQLDELWIKWDVVMLCANVARFEQTFCTNIVQVSEAYTSAGYVVRAGYLPLFRANVEQGIREAARIDVHWTALQREGTWLVFQPVVAYQRDGYSDIERRMTRYADKVALPMLEMNEDAIELCWEPQNGCLWVVPCAENSFDARTGELRARDLRSLLQFLRAYSQHRRVPHFRVDGRAFSISATCDARGQATKQSFIESVSSATKRHHFQT
jgi:GR25 family glycosyltransferase involved in LPS biosynthesis